MIHRMPVKDLSSLLRLGGISGKAASNQETVPI
jgi:hypothetical protein